MSVCCCVLRYDHAFAPRKNLQECLGEGNCNWTTAPIDALQCSGMQLDWMQKSEQSVEHYKNSKHSQIWGERMSKNASALSGNSNNHPHNLNTKQKENNTTLSLGELGRFPNWFERSVGQGTWQDIETYFEIVKYLSWCKKSPKGYLEWNENWRAVCDE